LIFGELPDGILISLMAWRTAWLEKAVGVGIE